MIARRSDRGDSAKRYEQKPLAPHSTIRTPGTGLSRRRVVFGLRATRVLM